MKIAILQNRIGIGGRNVVISEFVRLCNQHRVSPDIFTFSSSPDAERFLKEYGKNLDFNLRTIKYIGFKRGTAYQTPLLNALSYSALRGFDYVFNSGRCPYFLPEGPFYIHYVHFPLEASLRTEQHFKSTIGYIYTLPLKMLYYKRSNKVTNGIFLANSRFTASVTSQVYTSLDRSQIDVVYPPCQITRKQNNETRDLDFVSLGSIISDKRQLDQLLLARHFQEYSFHIIGGLKSRKYYQKCLNFIKENNLANVHLYIDASRTQVLDILSRSKLYIHTKHDEHFGISTVEAIDNGCLPVVHDSGGSREIVPYKDLRFSGIYDAISKITSLLSSYSETRKMILPELTKHILKYDKAFFHSAIGKIIFKKSA